LPEPERPRRDGGCDQGLPVAGRDTTAADALAAAAAEALLDETAEDLYENAPAGYVSSLPDGTIVRVNETFLTLTGHRRDDLVGIRRLDDLLAPGARIYYQTHYAPLLLMQGAVREIAVELLRADGRRVPVLLNSTLRRDATGAPRIVRTTVFDATDRRRYERELQRARADAETRARAALALEHVTDGVLLLDDEGRIDVLNGEAAAIIEVDADAAVGRPVGEVVPAWPALAERVPVGTPRVRTPPVVVPHAGARGGRLLTL
jgi:PAS domain S-box-containing protein